MRMGALVLDEALEATVVGSFSRIGYDLRSRTQRWPRPPSMAGKSAVVTGATSGLGLRTASALAELGASVCIVARDARRAEEARRAVEERRVPEAEAVRVVLADLSDLSAVSEAADRIREVDRPLDVLVHNAGALNRLRRTAPDGLELTVATHVVGPFLLTSLLLPLLREAAPGRVVTVSSGGMYTQRFELDDLVMGPDTYDGVVAYARAKRAQLVLNHEWARRVDPDEVVFHAMHPGWANTPGVRSSLPSFHRVMGPLLRSPQQGADTIVWLAAAAEAAASSGRFWMDRRRRWEHKLPWTRPASPPTDQAALWNWCVARSAHEPDIAWSEPTSERGPDSDGSLPAPPTPWLLASPRGPGRSLRESGC